MEKTVDRAVCHDDEVDKSLDYVLHQASYFSDFWAGEAIEFCESKSAKGLEGEIIKAYMQAASIAFLAERCVDGMAMVASALDGVAAALREKVRP